MLLYTGVYAPPPGAPVLSPNGDGFADVEPLAYKVVRPSTVTASLVGPDGVARPLDSGPKAPGLYTFTWNALRADGSPEQEGKWKLSVTAVDDQNATSTVEQPFTRQRHDRLSEGAGRRDRAARGRRRSAPPSRSRGRRR